MRLLVWLALFGLVVLALRSKLRRMSSAQNRASDAKAASGPASSMLPAEDMVACAQCQLFLPASEALYADMAGERRVFCCQEHLQGFRSGSA